MWPFLPTIYSENASDGEEGHGMTATVVWEYILGNALNQFRDRNFKHTKVISRVGEFSYTYKEHVFEILKIFVWEMKEFNLFEQRAFVLIITFLCEKRSINRDIRNTVKM